MKERNVFLSLIFILILLSAIIFTDMGYAYEEKINNNHNFHLSYSEFDVEFNKNSNLLNENVNIVGPREATLKDLYFTSVGEIQKITIPLINNSKDLSAKVIPNVYLKNNNEYFDVFCDINKSILKPNCDEAFVEITVKLKERPRNSIEKVEFRIDLKAEPIY